MAESQHSLPLQPLRDRLASALRHYDAYLAGLPDDQPVTVFDSDNEVEYELATSFGDCLNIGDLRQMLIILEGLNSGK